MENPSFWLGKKVKVKIDRPLGSKHPDYDLIYPVNYGYIQGIIAGDGEEIDAYVLGPEKAISEFEGLVIAIVKRKDDNENKLVVANHRYSKEEIKKLINFQEKYFKHQIIQKKAKI